MDTQKVKIMATLGPSSKKEEDLRRIKDKGVDFVRINMSHSSLEDLRYFIRLSKKVGIPFIIDTEGSQVRTGELETNTITLEENDEIRIYSTPTIGNKQKISFRPGQVIEQLRTGDLIQIDFDTLTLRVSDRSTVSEGYIIAKVVTGGEIGRNKAVVIDSNSLRKITLPSLSEKDYQSIEIGLEEGVGHIAASFIRSGESVDEVRKATQNTMKIISKIECIDGLENINEIIRKSDYLLIDRGDLSKEIPVEKIPFTQKIIINKARKQNTGVFVATNLLETMIEKKKPTRAEVHDVINTIVDGAYGLVLAAETAVGKHPMACINMLNKLIKHSGLAVNVEEFKDKENEFVRNLEESNYLLDQQISSSLVPPHGGKLVNRVIKEHPRQELDSLPKIKISKETMMDIEQIAIGTYSPLEGFLGKDDLLSVLENMTLTNGTVWPMPIILDVSIEEADPLNTGEDIGLVDIENEVMAILHLEEKFSLDKEEMASKMYASDNEEHPGVKMIKGLKPIFLSGKITLLKRMKSETKEYEITPLQARRLFEERGWAKVVGFHTRNVIHKSHEFIQMTALEKENCDGLFVHPVVGKKKKGDFHAKYIIKSYEKMIKEFYPKNKVFFGAFSTYSRYAGPREALFTALCRQNFGCSHFVIGRDHTGVSSFYHPKASHNIFDRFPEVEIKPIRFGKVFYSKTKRAYISENEFPEHQEDDKFHLSGTEARKIFERSEIPPHWFMRPEISQVIIDSINAGEEVFVRETHDE